MNLQQAIFELRSDPSFAEDWPPTAIEIWLRDQCRCVYCGMDMIANRDIAWFMYTFDHLLPQAKYAELATISWNKVLCCRPCNAYKGTYDPASTGKPVEADREQLLENARSHIRRRRAELDAKYAMQKLRLIDALRLLASETKSTAATAS